MIQARLQWGPDIRGDMTEIKENRGLPPRVICIHGTGGHPCIHWFPWLRDELEKKGFEVLVPWFPTPEGQHLDTWRSVFADEVGPLRPTDTLVGHSVGACFILRLLEGAPERILAAHLVAAPHVTLEDPDLNVLLASFIYERFDWNAIRQNARSIRIYHGDTDPYVPIGDALALGEQLGVPVSVYRGGGHLNTDAGYTEFDALLHSICRGG